MAKGRVLNGVLSGEALDSRQLAGEMAAKAEVCHAC